MQETPHTETPSQEEPKKEEPVRKEKLYRSRKDRMLGGVAAGIGEYFNLDPVVIRVAFVALFFINGLGLLLYLLLLLVVPKNPDQVDADRARNAKEFADQVGDKVQSVAEEFKQEFKDNDAWARSQNLAGLIILGFGVIALVAEVAPFRIDFDFLWPLILMSLGLFIIFKK